MPATALGVRLPKFENAVQLYGEALVPAPVIVVQVAVVASGNDIDAQLKVEPLRVGPLQVATSVFAGEGETIICEPVCALSNFSAEVVG